MKYLSVLFFFAKAVFAFGQSSIDYQLITNSWTEGKINSEGVVIQADINRGGWYRLNINSGGTVIFGDPFSCGFGSERQGKWTLKETDSTLSFTFSKRVGYMNSPGATEIKETEIYKIIKLTTDELILMQLVNGNKQMLPFIKTKE